MLAASCCAVAGAQNVNAGRIDVVQVNGLIDPSNAALIRTSLRDAERVHSTVVVFQIDASAAVDVDVNALLHDFTHATVPVTVWVGPSGWPRVARQRCWRVRPTSPRSLRVHGSDLSIPSGTTTRRSW